MSIDISGFLDREDANWDFDLISKSSHAAPKLLYPQLELHPSQSYCNSIE